jgi:hypothetical protein
MDFNALFSDNQYVFFAGRAALLFVALVLFALALWRWRVTGNRDMQRVIYETRELAAHTQRLVLQLSQMEARFEDRRQLAAASNDPAQRGYDLALQMARNGANPDELINASGVTRHEAQLLARLHNPVRS